MAAIMVLASMLLSLAQRSKDQQLHQPLDAFPMKIGQWRGKVDRFDDRVYEVLGVDDTVLAHYRSGTDDYIQLYIGYYQSQREGEIIHSPKNCMPGAGWNIVDTALVDIGRTGEDGKPIKVLKLSLQNGVKRQVALYWYHSRGRVITSEYLQKIYLVADALVRQRTDGSFVRLLSPVGLQGEEKIVEDLKNFAKKLYPVLGHFIPA